MDRRDFSKKVAIGATGLLLLNMGDIKASSANVSLLKNIAPNDAKKVFKEKGTCSQTFCHLLNREFAHNNENIERATDLLAGGLMQSGHQCGMLWGSSVAIGAECFRRYENKNLAMAASVETTKHLMQSFSRRAGTISCRNITNTDFNSKWDMLKYISKIVIHGMENNICFVLAENWMPEALATAKENIGKVVDFSQPTYGCSSEVVKKMGGSLEEQTMVAGFAGGLGLSGNACGALSASIWMRTLEWCKKHPGEKPPYFNNKEAKQIFHKFNLATKSEILCQNICGHRFSSVGDHSMFVKNGGCAKLINALAS